jgi:hypothetical protein
MPGVNDARTKKTYYDYLKNNFNKFNIILLVIDINSGTNTSDEIDIIDFVCENINNNNKINKKTKLIIIANKIDDMNWNTSENILEFGNEEHEEMFNQIKKTITEYSKKHQINQNLEKIIPLCGLDSFLFRMIESKGKNYKLTKSQIIKIGTSEKGQKFKYKTTEEQKEIITNIISNKDFVKDMIKLSGFEELNNTLLDCIINNSNDFVKKNIMYEITKIDKNDITNFNNTYLEKIKILIKLIKYDYDEFEIQFNKILKEFSDEFINYVENENICDFMTFYNIYEEIYISNIKLIINIQTDNNKLFDLVIKKNLQIDLDTNNIINFKFVDIFIKYIEIDKKNKTNLSTIDIFNKQIKILIKNKIMAVVILDFIEEKINDIINIEDYKKIFFNTNILSSNAIVSEMFDLENNIIFRKFNK